MGLVLFSIGVGILSTHVPPAEEKETIETSSHDQMRCPAPHGGIRPQPIRVGKFNSFWYESVTATQLAGGLYYTLTANVYLIPEKKLPIRTQKYTCPCNQSNCEYLYLRYFYLLEGSSVDFSLIFNSTSTTNPGFVNLTICDNYVNFNEADCSLQYPISVRPHATGKAFKTRFTAPKDSYYFVTTYNQFSMNALIHSYQVDVEMKYLNESDLGTNVAAHFSRTESQGISKQIFDNNGLASATNYVIVAAFDYSEAFGKMRVTKHHRNLVYVVPAIAAASFMLLGVIFVACICVCYCIVKRIIRRRRKGRELSIPINY